MDGRKEDSVGGWMCKGDGEDMTGLGVGRCLCNYVHVGNGRRDSFNG